MKAGPNLALNTPAASCERTRNLMELGSKSLDGGNELPDMQSSFWKLYTCMHLGFHGTNWNAGFFDVCSLQI